MTHTPGPWTASHILGGSGYTNYAILAADGNPEAPWTICKGTRGIPKANAYANSILIAAAPDMLAALKRQAANIARWLETGIASDAEESRSISEQIDAAIAKAEGKP